MSLLNGTISGITRLKIEGKDLAGLSGFDEKIKSQAFRSQFPINTEKSVGFVSINDCLDSDLTAETTLLGDYRIFSMRIDRRTVPASSLKIKVLEETKKRLKETGQKKLSKRDRENIKDAMKTELMKNLPPVTAVYDVAVNTATGIVYAPFLTANLIQEFVDVFKEAFGVPLQLYSAVRQEDLGESELPPALGRAFLSWLWFKSQQKEGQVNIEGKDYALQFTRRIVLESGDGDELERVVYSGKNFDLGEAKGALRQGKLIKEVRIKIEKDESTWEFNYKPDLFQFASVKLPSSSEMGENESPEGRNLERLFIISELAGLMDSLFQGYLRMRLSSLWPIEANEMLPWLEGDIHEQ